MINTTEAVRKLFMDGHRQVMRATLSSTAGRASTVHDDGTINTLDGVVTETGTVMKNFFFPIWGEVLTTEAYEDVEITQADIVEGGLSIDSYSMSGSRVELGAAIASELNLSLRNSDGAFDSTNFDGIEIHVELGVKDWSTDDPVSWIDMGYFLTDKSPSKRSVIKLSALDRMTRFDQPVDWELYRFPIPLRLLVERTCEICRVPLGTDLSLFPNSLYYVAAPYTDNVTSYRNLIQWAAFLTGTCAQINQNGELVFRWYTPSGFTLTAANRYTHEIDDKDLTITGIRYGAAEETYIVGDTTYPIDFSGCGILQDLHDLVLSNVWNTIKGFSYRPFEATVQSVPFLQPMDMISYEDSKGTYNCIISHITYTMNRGTPISGTGQSAVDASYSELSGLTREQSRAVDDAAKTATNYLSRDSSGIMIADMSSGETYLPSEVPQGVKNTFIDANSFDVRDGTKTLASFGETSTIGTDSGYLQIEPSLMKASNAAGKTVFRVSNFNTYDGGKAHVSLVIEGTRTNPIVYTNYTVSEVVDAYIAGTGEKVLPLPTINPDNNTSVIVQTLPTQDWVLELATTDSVYSAAIGTLRSANSPRSISIGELNSPYGLESVTIGTRVDTKTNSAIGIGRYLLVDVLRPAGNQSAQTAIGRYNEQKSGATVAFLIGTGTSATNRKNALEITTDDDLLLHFDANAAQGTTDGDLAAALTELGILNDVIE